MATIALSTFQLYLLSGHRESKMAAIEPLFLSTVLEGARASTGLCCGCEQWSNNISESNYNMQPITIQFAVRVRKDYTHAPCMFIWAKFGVRGV